MPDLLPAFDAFTVVACEVEPLGSHATEEAALDALGHLDGGAVTIGMNFLRWHPNTNDLDRALIREALRAHGIRAGKRQTWDDRP